MDTITHGIAGALIGKALCGGEDMFPPKPMSAGRIATWALMIGAIFPDSDVFRDMLSKDPMLIITWHRSFTHSLLLLPLFALLLAALTLWIARKFGWEAPSFGTLTGIYAIGILSHVLLDLVTTFGTMIWSPLNWSRPAWDLLFIIDFSFTAILLAPQFLAWAHRDAEKARLRSLLVWLLCVIGTFGAAAIARIVGAPISPRATVTAIFVFTVLCLVPAFRKGSWRPSPLAWNRTGFAGACIYIALAAFAHHKAVERVERFARFQGAQVETIGALPFPPSIWNWDGLVRTTRGVYEIRMDLSQPSGIPGSEAEAAAAAQVPFTYKYFPDAPPNGLIEQALRLPEVQKVLWFDRFPVTRFHKEGSESVVEILDLRFPAVRPDRPAAFTYQVRFDAAGGLIEQGWVRD